MSVPPTWSLVALAAGIVVGCGGPSEPCSAGVATSCAYSCKQGDGPSCAKLGAMAETGSYSGSDVPDAVAFYARACKLGDSRGCHMEGLKLMLGIGVATDLARAEVAFGEGCNLQNPDSCAMLGAVRSLSGQAAGIESLKLSCQMGPPLHSSADGCALLARALERGIGVPPSPEEAAVAYQRACSLGDTDACTKSGTKDTTPSK